MSRSLPVSLPLLAIAVGALLPAGALARPSLSFDAPCYSAGDTIAYSGGGYTPDGEVNMFFGTAGKLVGRYATHADATGALSGRLDAPDPGRFMDSAEDAAEVGVSANDQARLDADAGPEESVGFATFRLSRFGFRMRTPGNRDMTPRRPVRFEVTGYTNAVGRPAFLHYRRAGRTLETVRLGTLRGPCGDLKKSLRRAFPFRPVPAGEYKLAVTTSPTSATRAPMTRATVRVARRDAVR